MARRARRAPGRVSRAAEGAPRDHRCHRSRAARDRPPAQLYIGPCDFCGTPLYAERGASGTHRERCRAYFADVDDRWERALRRLRGYPATAALIAGSIGELYGIIVSRKLINSWHHRGMVQKVDDDDPDTGDPRFRIGEVLDRAAKSRSRKAGWGLPRLM